MSDNIYDEPKMESGSKAETETTAEEQKDINFVLGTPDSGPDLLELTDGISIPDSVIYLTGEVNEHTLTDVIKKVRTVLKNRDESLAEESINLIVDTFGGCAYSTLGIVDFIETLDVPVNTICRGKAMSAGAIILSAGTGTRLASKRASIMVHQGMAYSSGKTGDLRSSAKHYTTMDDMVYNVLGDRTKKDADWWRNNLQHDKFMTSEEALEIGIIDEIG